LCAHRDCIFPSIPHYGGQASLAVAVLPAIPAPEDNSQSGGNELASRALSSSALCSIVFPVQCRGGSRDDFGASSVRPQD
jgi:hypothetical protein